MIDYSKWDKLEVSDDSDVEVHPNVDKKSFIRLKQRQIHEERMKRDNDIKLLKTQLEMYEHLNKRVDKMLLGLNDEQLFDEKTRNEYLNTNFDPEEKNGEANEVSLGYNEMIEDLFAQAFEEKKVSSGPELRKYLVEHRLKIDKVSVDARNKLDELLKARSEHITSEDIHTGFDSFYTNKDQIQKQSVAKKSSAGKQVVEQIETINTPKSKELTKASKPEAPVEEPLKAFPETEEFGSIDMTEYTKSAKFLRTHPFILTDNQKDSLMASAFDLQLKDDFKRAKNVVHQALIIQYICDLVGKDKSATQLEKAMAIFFEKIIHDNTLLMKECESTYAHIVKRCEILKQENSQEDEQEQKIQLRSTDPNTELTVNIPDPAKDKEKYEKFLKLPADMQKAVKTGSLDEINSVFEHLKIDKAEECLQIFEDSGVIGIQAVLENEQEWDKMQENKAQEVFELRSSDPNAKLVILAPNKDNKEEYEAFLQLPPEMQNAVENESLDDVNAIFARTSSDKATEMLQLLEKAGVMALMTEKVPQPSLEDEID